MKREVINSIVALIITIFIAVCAFCVYSFAKGTTDQEYFEILGIEDYSLQYFEELLSRTPSENIIELDSKVLQVRQEGYDVFLIQNENDNLWYRCGFMRIEIYDTKYKFENGKIAVGVDKETVNNVYKKYSTIKDLPENQIGYIVNNLWVCFELDNSVVDKILLYYGP